jgi:hypothetical protein
MPSIYSLNPKKDRVVQNRIKRIEYTGNKQVFEVITREGFKIKSSADHKFLQYLIYMQKEKILGILGSVRGNYWKSKKILFIVFLNVYAEIQVL